MANSTFSGMSPPIDQLPADFQAALAHSQAGTSTPADDAVIGSALAGSGYCAGSAFAHQLYCACVNAPVADPECVFAPCANYTAAYKTSQMQKVLADADQNCPATVDCTQVFEMGGDDNVATGISQSMDCGNVVSTIMTSIGDHPVVALILVVLTALLVSVVAGGQRRVATGGRHRIEDSPRESTIF